MVEVVVLHGDWTLHTVSESFEKKLVHLGLEPSRVPCGPGHPDPRFVRCLVIRLSSCGPCPQSEEQQRDQDSQYGNRCSAHGVIRLGDTKVSHRSRIPGPCLFEGS